MERTVQVRIEGLVQGVGYRAWVARTAAQLSLSGFVRNANDGSVTAGFSGPAVAIDEMLTLLESGPPAAEVSNVTILSEGGPSYQDFEIRR